MWGLFGGQAKKTKKQKTDDGGGGIKWRQLTDLEVDKLAAKLQMKCLGEQYDVICFTPSAARWESLLTGNNKLCFPVRLFLFSNSVI